MNISLLCNWWWILENEEGLWQEIVNLKYVKGTPICLVKQKYSDSPVWSDLLKIRHLYLKGREYKVNNGKMMSFWRDLWTGDMPLCRKYPILFDLCENQDCSVYDVAREGLVIRFKVRLPPALPI
jgi:hypothetical protein